MPQRCRRVAPRVDSLPAPFLSDAGVRATGPPAATNSAQAQVQELLALADGLLPAESPQAQEQQQTSLRDALKESWAGKVRTSMQALQCRGPPLRAPSPVAELLRTLASNCGAVSGTEAAARYPGAGGCVPSEPRGHGCSCFGR